MRLIDADKLEEYFQTWVKKGKKQLEKIDITENPAQFELWITVMQDRLAYLHDVKNAETIEPPIKEGKWVKMNDGAVECSICGYIWREVILSINIKYCPHCGAKMRGPYEN